MPRGPKGEKRPADVIGNAVSKLLVDAGKACAAFHDEKVRDVKARRVQVDEIWSFTYAKQKNVRNAKKAPAEAGDTWTWTGIEAETKLILSWLVGGRPTIVFAGPKPYFRRAGES